MKNVIAVQFARKLSGRTDYRKRLALLKSSKPRLVVRKTLTGIILQIIDFDLKGDVVRTMVTSKALKGLGWQHSCKNIPAAYLTGMLIGKLALESKISEAVPDIGLQSVTKGGKIFAAIKGAKDAGLNVPISDEILPDAETIKGAKIVGFAKSAKAVQFAKAGAAAAKITEDFEKTKAMIAAGKFKPAAKVK
jgi:large subunit ribosomal protein L18